MRLFRFCVPQILILLCTLCFLFGGWWPFIFFLGLSLTVIVGDAWGPNDECNLSDANALIANILLLLTLPNLLLLLAAAIYVTSAPLAVIITKSFPIITLQIPYSTPSTSQLLGIILSLGLLIGGVGTSVAHECIHRKRGHFLTWVGNWLMALSMDSIFPIEHNHGHHKHVGTANDSATARYGENVYRFIARSTIGEYKNAWKVEKLRLRKRNIPTISIQNRYLQAIVRSLSIPIVIMLIGGAQSGIVIAIAMFWAKALLETVNYIEHYGLVRVPEQPINPRHSWNSNAWMSGTITFLLTRHSHHHQKGNLPFWKLQALPKAPMLPWGYLSAIYLALLTPKLYRKLMEPILQNWIQHYATPEERRLASIP